MVLWRCRATEPHGEYYRPLKAILGNLGGAVKARAPPVGLPGPLALLEPGLSRPGDQRTADLFGIPPIGIEHQPPVQEHDDARSLLFDANLVHRGHSDVWPGHTDTVAGRWTFQRATVRMIALRVVKRSRAACS